MKNIVLILCVLFLCSSSYAGNIDKLKAVIAAKNAGSEEPPSGQAFSDDFTYSDGELESVSSGVWEKLTGSDSSVASGEFGIVDGSVYVYATATDTVSQYAAIRRLTYDGYNGLYARQVAKDNATTLAYCLRGNQDANVVLRYCTGASCSTIHSITYTWTVFDDSIGLEVIGIDDATKWKIWIWDGQDPPARASWGNCHHGVYITGQTATTCDTSNTAVSDLGANYADTGKYLGIYSGGGATDLFDAWIGGDAE